MRIGIATGFALVLLPLGAFASPKDGTYSNAKGVTITVSSASDAGFDFVLVAGGQGGCSEGDTACLQVQGHAQAGGKGYTYIDPNDDHSRVFFADAGEGLKVLSTTGDLGTGTANRQQMLALTGDYAPSAKPADTAAAPSDQPADAATDPAAEQDSTGDAAPEDGTADGSDMASGDTGEDDASAEGITDFITPSGNIGCEVINSDRYEVRCDMLKLNRSYVNAPDDCEEDWGDSFHIAEKDAKGSLVCHGDTVVFSDSDVLDYGKSESWGDLTCTSEKSGLTCQNAEGHGFSLSRKQQQVF